MQRVSVLGSTGSIGTAALDVIAHHPGELTVAALAAARNVELLARQANRFKPEVLALLDGDKVDELRRQLDYPTEIWVGPEGVAAAAAMPEADTVLVAIVGAAGLPATCAAAQAGKRICLANKEALVIGGHLVTRLVASGGAELLPVDSEHSAIFQCLWQGGREEVFGIYLTASGGPFRQFTREQLAQVTPEMALQHPTWTMGRKITIDSATLMNKGLEVIEAHWLFSLDWAQIKVLVHPQSIIHSMVEFTDGSILAQLGTPDMRLPIQAALLYPQRRPAPVRRLDFSTLSALTFELPDLERFPCLSLAYRAGMTGGTAPAVLNAANEVAVELFLKGELPFMAIPRVVEESLAGQPFGRAETLEEILAVDGEARREAARVAGKLKSKKTI
ncbi:MAG TPA: 1-deoxy-D-xylulose-5-phosphate reductoisomerase [Firmicutes bacterium]|nr:1-deoxy-D-xylulose-5-phosphate reductoisomerase [Bacillota bacterium]